MQFETLDNTMLTENRQLAMYEEVIAGDVKTEVETKVNDKWQHDSNDTIRT